MRLLLTLVVGLQLTAAGVAVGQHPGPRRDALVAFESWHVTAPVASRRVPVGELAALRANRSRRVLIGGAIGAAAGIVACTAISTLASDSADGGLSFCPLDTYLLVGGAGFLAGAAVAWLF